MPHIRQLARVGKPIKPPKKVVNWFPGHMYAGMQAMIGKLNTVDCIVEVHDSRIPFIGRNQEFRQHLGMIKPRILVLNKSDLADLTRWDAVRRRLLDEGEKHVFLTDLSGSEFSFSSRGYTKLLDGVITAINESDRFNRKFNDRFKIMVVGIPNVGKSTLINRLRQHHFGIKGNPAKVGPEAGVTKHVDNSIRICKRPPIYSLDTPGVLPPGALRDNDQAMRLAACSTIADKALDPQKLATYILHYLNDDGNFSYLDSFELEGPAVYVEDLHEAVLAKLKSKMSKNTDGQEPYMPQIDDVCRRFINEFRKGLYGKIMFS